MPTIITRLFAAEDQALAALASIKHKFAEDEVNLVTPASAENPDLEALIVKGGVKPEHAAAYAEAVRGGSVVVTVKAAWGMAKDVIGSLEAQAPLAAVVEETERSVAAPGWDNPTPLSSLLGLPVLEECKSKTVLVDQAAPLSNLLKLPVTFESKPWASLLHIGPFSGLINNPAPLSSALKLPVLLNTKKK